MREKERGRGGEEGRERAFPLSDPPAAARCHLLGDDSRRSAARPRPLTRIRRRATDSALSLTDSDSVRVPVDPLRATVTAPRLGGRRLILVIRVSCRPARGRRPWQVARAAAAENRDSARDRASRADSESDRLTRSRLRPVELEPRATVSDGTGRPQAPSQSESRPTITILRA